MEMGGGGARVAIAPSDSNKSEANAAVDQISHHPTISAAGPG